MTKGWLRTTLGEVARWGSGGTPQAGNSAYYGGSIPWAVIGDLNDAVVSSTASRITDEGLNRSSAKMVPSGAVLVAMYGSIGKLGIAGVPMATNQAIAFAVPGASLDRDFFFYYLLSQRQGLDAAGKGATQLNIGQAILKAWPIRYPKVSEQQRIVAILDEHLSDLDNAQASLHRAEARVNRLRSAELERLFGPGDRSKCRIEEVISHISAGKSFGATNRPATADEWGIIKVSAMTWGEFRPEENKAVPAARVDHRFVIRPGDLLVSRANTSAYVGASVLVPEGTRHRLLLSDKSLRLIPREDILVEWLWRALQAPTTRREISARATGTKDSMRNISQEELKRVQVPIADPSEQHDAVVAFAELDAVIRRQELVLRSVAGRGQSLRRAVLAAAFSGRLTGHASDTDVIEELVEEESA